MEDYLKEMSDSSVPPGRVTVVRFCSGQWMIFA